MVKLVFCCRKKPGMTLEEFQRRWLDVHGPLVSKLKADLPQMQRYVQSHTLPGPVNDMLRESRGTREAYDGITEIWFEDLESIGGDGGERSVEAAIALYEDEVQFMDFDTSSVFVTKEHEIF